MLAGSLHMRCSGSLPSTALRPCVQRPAPCGAGLLRASRPQVHQRCAARQAAPVTAVAKKAAVEEGPVASATLKFKPGSPHKFRRVLDQIRGRSYEEALMILEYLPYRAVEHILPTLMSAAANAKENLNMSKLNLYVSECYADGGPVMKRFTNGYKGRAYKILKPSSHLTIKVRERKAAKKPTPAPAA